MKAYPTEIIYLGFFLPALFSLTFFVEGIYKIYKHEEGLLTLGLGCLFLLGLGAFYFFIIAK